MLDFIINSLNFLAFSLPSTSDCSLLGEEFQNILNEVFEWLQIATPCLVILLCSVDLAQAVIAQDEKSMQASLPKVVKRVGIGVAIFFLPILLDFILKMAGIASGICKIGM